MSAVLKIFLSMSFSGSLLILALLLGKRFLKNKISRQWQYYIWLVVVLRLLFPFGPEDSLMGKAYQAVDQAISQTAPLPPQQQPPLNAPGSNLAPAVGAEQYNETVNNPADDVTTAHPLQDIGVLLVNHIWLVWLAAALGLLIRKITIYQGFMRYIRAGSTPISDIERLDELSIVAKQSGIKKPVELCVDPLVSSPLLIGFFHPCIVLSSVDIPEKDFRYIILHELTHYKRRDIFYKWLVQITVCLHWFNPLVHLMCREITRACEFSCDEAVLTKMGGGSAQDYGQTLLDAMAAVGRYKENFGTVTLNGNKKLLKERISAIMNFKKKSMAIRLLTGVLTLCVMFGAAFVGVYPVAAAANCTTGKHQVPVDKTPAQGNTGTSNKDYAAQAERYYEADSLPLFEITFPRLDENTQKKWLEKFYADGEFAFFSVAVRWLDTNSALFTGFAEKAYVDEEMAFFSILTDCMEEMELELWLDRALEDGNWACQSMLFDKLNRGGEFDELKERQEQEWAEAQTAEYRAVGVTMDGKDYYYAGQLVNIFLDIRPNKSVYTLNMNPKGTVNIKIIRDANNKITGVSYMTEAEVIELFGDMDEPDDNTGMEIIPVDFKTVAAEETIFLGEYTLSDGDEILYDLSAKTGNRMVVFFAKDGQSDVSYWSVNNLRQPGEPLECIADFTVGPSMAGTYRLYLQAPDGALGNVKGSISIVSADAS
mgnify:CR=1 FL=1